MQGRHCFNTDCCQSSHLTLGRKVNTLCKDDSYMELHEATLMKTFSNKCACVLHKFWGTNKKLFLVKPYKINFDSIFTVMSITTTSYIASLPSFSVVLFITKFEFSSVIASFKSWRCNLDSSVVHKLILSFFLKGSKHSLLALLITTDWLNCCLEILTVLWNYTTGREVRCVSLCVWSWKGQ